MGKWGRHPERPSSTVGTEYGEYTSAKDLHGPRSRHTMQWAPVHSASGVWAEDFLHIIRVIQCLAFFLVIYLQRSCLPTRTTVQVIQFQAYRIQTSRCIHSIGISRKW